MGDVDIDILYCSAFLAYSHIAIIISHKVVTSQWQFFNFRFGLEM